MPYKLFVKSVTSGFPSYEKLFGWSAYLAPAVQL